MKPLDPLDLLHCFLRLRPDASIEPLPVDASFAGRLQRGELGDFHHEYLVSMFDFDRDWPVWECHPSGDEVVCLLSGSVRFVLETGDGAESRDLREPGAFLIVPRGTWHTAKVERSCRMLFLTAGEGTLHRPA